MKRYAEQNLLPNEIIIYQTHRSSIIFFQPFLWLVLMVSCLFFPDLGRIAWLFFILAAISGVMTAINYYMSEMVVTNMRVLIKMGIITVRSLEVTLQNIASIEITQNILGKLLNYGEVVVRDTGMTRALFQYIDDPFAFRKAVYSQIDKRYPAP